MRNSMSMREGGKRKLWYDESGESGCECGGAEFASSANLSVWPFGSRTTSSVLIGLPRGLTRESGTGLSELRSIHHDVVSAEYALIPRVDVLVDAESAAEDVRVVCGPICTVDE